MTGLAELSCVFGQKEMIKAAQEASGIKLTFKGIPESENHSKNWRTFCRRLNPILNDKMPDSVYDLLAKWYYFYFFLFSIFFSFFFFSFLKNKKFKI